MTDNEHRAYRVLAMVGAGFTILTLTLNFILDFQDFERTFLLGLFGLVVGIYALFRLRFSNPEAASRPAETLAGRNSPRLNVVAELTVGLLQDTLQRLTATHPKHMPTVDMVLAMGPRTPAERFVDTPYLTLFLQAVQQLHFLQGLRDAIGKDIEAFRDRVTLMNPDMPRGLYREGDRSDALRALADGSFLREIDVGIFNAYKDIMLNIDAYDAVVQGWYDDWVWLNETRNQWVANAAPVEAPSTPAN